MRLTFSTKVFRIGEPLIAYPGPIFLITGIELGRLAECEAVQPVVISQADMGTIIGITNKMAIYIVILCLTENGACVAIEIILAVNSESHHYGDAIPRVSACRSESTIGLKLNVDENIPNVVRAGDTAIIIQCFNV